MNPAPNGTPADPIRATIHGRGGIIVASDGQRAALSVPRACPYCGAGPCRSTARTIIGGDLDRFERIHPAHGFPARRRLIVRHWSELEPVSEHG